MRADLYRVERRGLMNFCLLDPEILSRDEEETIRGRLGLRIKRK